MRVLFKNFKFDEKRTPGQTVLDDFLGIRKAGISHPDMGKIEALLKGN